MMLTQTHASHPFDFFLGQFLFKAGYVVSHGMSFALIIMIYDIVYRYQEVKNV